MSGLDGHSSLARKGYKKMWFMTARLQQCGTTVSLSECFYARERLPYKRELHAKTVIDVYVLFHCCLPRATLIRVFLSALGVVVHV